MAVLAGLVMGTRLVLKRWVDGADPEPVREAWPKVPAARSAAPQPTGPPRAAGNVAAPASVPPDAPPTSPAPAEELAAPAIGAEDRPRRTTPSAAQPATPSTDAARVRPLRAPRPDRPLRAKRAPTKKAASAPDLTAALDPETAPDPEAARATTARTAAPSATGTESTWVAPHEDGSAPDSHPVKAKVGSRTYRVPGMAAYDRIKADRCYASAQAAEADGFTRAKR